MRWEELEYESSPPPKVENPPTRCTYSFGYHTRIFSQPVHRSSLTHHFGWAKSPTVQLRPFRATVAFYSQPVSSGRPVGPVRPVFAN